MSSGIGCSLHAATATVVVCKMDVLSNNQRIPLQKSSFVSFPFGHLLSIYRSICLNVEAGMKHCLLLWTIGTAAFDFTLEICLFVILCISLVRPVNPKRQSPFARCVSWMNRVVVGLSIRLNMCSNSSPHTFNESFCFISRSVTLQ